MQPFNRFRRTGAPRPQAQSLGYELVQFETGLANSFVCEVLYCEPHWHEACELIVVLSGTVEVRVHDCTHILNPGGAIFIDADALHTLHAWSSPSCVLAIQFAPGLTRLGSESACTGFDYQVAAKDQWTRADREILGLAVDIASKADTAGVGRFARLEPIYRLLASLEAAQRCKAISPTTRIGDPLEPIKGAIGYINEHFVNDLRLTEVANAVCIDYFKLSRLFKSTTGLGFKEYLTLLRLGRARTLLRDAAISITQVSELSGFNEHKHLDAAFRRYHGITPSQYRKTLLSAKPLEKGWREEGVNRQLEGVELQEALAQAAASLQNTHPSSPRSVPEPS
ncbi:AraC family transcriptional regulator [Pantoea sp. Tr-811]|uniref:AraC family transcriptional regulator n=1 Tax=Pantoea sp. Tr-811 TaxID=2608361 RepID=UPI0014240F43|nr:AraC family transcriptional regulator [Pantoea sp. Tr-811]NIF28946.1 AraC family transcriptional regulator [Pantoea sp. Tr-811]